MSYFTSAFGLIAMDRHKKKGGMSRKMREWEWHVISLQPLFGQHKCWPPNLIIYSAHHSTSALPIKMAKTSTKNAHNLEFEIIFYSKRFKFALKSCAWNNLVCGFTITFYRRKLFAISCRLFAFNKNYLFHWHIISIRRTLN